MPIHEMAGTVAPKTMLANIFRLVSAYYTHKPDVSEPAQRVVFGTSGHRGSSLKNSFNEDHILAIGQAICEYRASQHIDGPLFMGMDTHALSEPALASALEVFAAAGVNVMVQKGLGYTPTPVISHAILAHNQNKRQGLADGVVITPSHNHPEDGGFKYNPPHGGPAGDEITRRIADRANEILKNGIEQVHRIPFEIALKADTTHEYDYIPSYVEELADVVDMERIESSGLKLTVDPLGGDAVDYWASNTEFVNGTAPKEGKKSRDQQSSSETHLPNIICILLLMSFVIALLLVSTYVYLVITRPNCVAPEELRLAVTVIVGSYIVTIIKLIKIWINRN